MNGIAKYIGILVAGLLLGWGLFGNSGGRLKHPGGGPTEGVDESFHRCPMHTWVKSALSGSCTVCGMDLVVVLKSSESEPAQLNVNLSKSATRIAGLATGASRLNNLIKRVRVSGWLRENDDVSRTIAARVPGRIEKLITRYEGKEVTAGDRLYSIYSPKLLEWEKEYNLLYRQSQMNHTSRITAEHGRLLKAMRQRLLQHGLTGKQIDELPRKPENVSVTDIFSVSSGMVVEHSVEEGDYVEEGDALMRVVDLFRLWYEFDVYDGDLAEVSIGQRVSLDLEGERGRTMAGTISFINSIREVESRSARARVELQNPTARVQGVKVRPLDPNTYAEGQIRIQRDGLLSVPRTAVLGRDEGYIVFVESDGGVLRQQSVKVGFKGDVFWEISSGLTNGSRIVLDGAVVLDSHIRL